MVNKKLTGLEVIHGPIAIALIVWIWVRWTDELRAPHLANDDLSLGWYFFFLSVTYSIVILVSRRLNASALQRHQLSIGGHAFFLLAWYAIRMKPAVQPNGDRILVNEYYLFAFVVTLTLGLLAPFVIFRAKRDGG